MSKQGISGERGQVRVTPEVWSKADLHIHSDHSDGLAKIPEIMDYVHSSTDLSVIAITDHNTIEGALFAQSLSEMYDFDVIVGSEVSSKQGHVLGLFLEKDIPAGMSAADTVRAIEDQDGIAIIPHPFSAQGVFGPSGRSTFAAAINEFAFHALEVYNSLPYLSWANKAAASTLTGGRGFAATGGSDAHVLRAVGQGYTLFKGTTADDLRHSIKRLETRGEAEPGGLSLAVRYMLRYPQIRQMQSWNWERCKAK
jgi:predicted metal-dependent phosphoesterase TrpH